MLLGSLLTFKRFLRRLLIRTDDGFQVYDRLGVSLIERGESFYQDLMKSMVDFLDNKGFLELDEGRKVMFAKGIQVSRSSLISG